MRTTNFGASKLSAYASASESAPPETATRIKSPAAQSVSALRTAERIATVLADMS